MTDYDLNIRQKRFAMEVTKGKTLKQAYIDAGYNPGTDQSAYSNASKLMNKDKVLAYISSLMDKQELRTRCVENKARYQAIQAINDVLTKIHNIMGRVLSEDRITEEDRENISTLNDLVRTILKAEKTEVNVNLKNILERRGRDESFGKDYEKEAKEIMQIIDKVDGRENGS